MDDFQGLAQVIGEVILRRRKAAAMTQEKLAELAKLERSYLSLLEHGKRMPGLEVIYRLAGAFGIKPTTLVAEIDQRWNERSGKKPS